MDERCRLWGVQEKSLREFRRWFHSQPHLPKHTPDDYLAQFLHSCYHDLERAKKSIDVFFRLKTNSPELFADRNMDNEGLQRFVNVCQVGILPERTEQGYRVVFGRLVDPVPSHLVIEDAIKYLCMLVDVILRDEPGCSGIMFVYDITNYSFRHIFRISMTTVRKYFDYVQDGCPMRHKGVNLFNASYVATQLLAIAKPFMYKEHAKMLVFYNPSQTDGFLKTLSPTNVPAEYGGKGPSVEQIQHDTIKKLRSYADWFKFDESLKVVPTTS